MILIIDFGSQYNQLIARRVRECNVFCQIEPPGIGLDKIKELNPDGIILSGGPGSVYEPDSPKTDPEIFNLAQTSSRIIISMDKDFTNILLYPPGEHYGIIVVKLYGLKVNHATQIFLRSLSALTENDLQGNIVIIDRNKIRIRKEKL